MYYLTTKKYTICTSEDCNESHRTFDMKLFDLANNEKLTDKLNLPYIVGSAATKYTYEKRGIWFSGYIDSFKVDKNYLEDLMKNPTIRLLIFDEELLKEVTEVLASSIIVTEAMRSILQIVNYT